MNAPLKMIEMTHMSVDIETWAKVTGAVVLSVGAAVFHPEEGLIESKRWILHRAIQINRGRIVDPDTVEWWMGQSIEARAVSFCDPDDRVLPITCLRQLQDLWSDTGCSMAWGLGATFDLGIMEDLYGSFLSTVPWSHKQQGCLRTLGNLLPEVTRPMASVAHDPEQDAIAQGEWAMALIKRAAHG